MITSDSPTVHQRHAVPRTISPVTLETRTIVFQQSTASTKPSKKAAARKKRSNKFVWRKRDAQDSRFYNLQLDINDLKQSIQELTQHRQLLYARQLSTPQCAASGSSSFVATVVEYLRVFRHGIDAAPVDVVAFLTQIMAEDVWINEFRGNIDLIVAQWKVYSACFAGIHLQYRNSIVLAIEDASGNAGLVVRAHAQYSARITHTTISTMFPHVLRFPHITNQLLGRTLRGHSHYDFVFDCHSARILRCDVALDFFSAFARLLPHPHDLNIVFHGAKVESGFYLGDGDDKPAQGAVVEQRPFKDQPQSPLSDCAEDPHHHDQDHATRPASPSRACDKMRLDHILT